MKNLVLNINLWGKTIAATTWDEDREVGVIEFNDTLIREGLDVAPLMIPLEDIARGERIFQFPALGRKTFKGLPGLLSDSLPDDYGNRIIDEWFASRGRTAGEITPIDRLCYVGQRGMGALEYEPTNHDGQLNDSTRIDIQTLTALAQKILNDREAFQANLKQNNQAIIDILKIGTSAGGAKPKAIIAYNEQTKDVRSGQVKAPEGYTYWLLKFDGVESKNVNDNPMGIGRIEYAYYKMASDCGIRMMESRLLPEGNHAHFMTKRFDRLDSGEKVHVQTLAAMAHYDRNERYSYEQAFEVCRRLHLPYSDQEQLYRRMVFNVVARNHDDHTKNHSFLMSREGEWSLAPAYDLCYSYSSQGKWTQFHQMSLAGKRSDFTYRDLLTVAGNVGIRQPEKIIDPIIDVVSRWKEYASAVGVSREHADYIGERLMLLTK